MDQKRNSLDAEAKKRRESFNDQKPATGFVGNMWNRYKSQKPPSFEVACLTFNFACSIMKGHDTK